MRNISIIPIGEKSIQTAPMSMVTGSTVVAAGGVEGTGATLVVDHTGDNNIVSFRFKNKARWIIALRSLPGCEAM